MFPVPLMLDIQVRWFCGYSLVLGFYHL